MWAHNENQKKKTEKGNPELIICRLSYYLLGEYKRFNRKSIRTNESSVK